MEKTTYTGYLHEYSTDIPIIQRDYVQGLDTMAEKRDEFLRTILDTLLLSSDSSGLSLDFIYGTTYTAGSRQVFIPIDGQQRLTTLALIGWLLAQKTSPEKYTMPELRYRTRHTTEQFCKCLFSYRIPKDLNAPLSKHLLSEPIWMAERWLTDPSVKAMIDMLDAAEKMLAEPKYASKLEDMAHRFFTDNPLSFYLLDMNHPVEISEHANPARDKRSQFKLTEDLYIKMNARGKLLTPHENWKAQFTGMLETEYKDIRYRYAKIEGEEVSIPEYFSYAIEHQWTDLLWLSARKAWENLSEEQRKESLYPRVDEHFMALLDFCTEALYLENFRDEDDVKSEYERLKKFNFNLKLAQLFAGDRNQWIGERRIEVYRKQKNVETLFRLLDALVHLADGKGVDGLTPFFAAFIYHGKWDSSSQKVCVSEEMDTEKFSANLLKMCTEYGASDAWTRQLKMLLWGILHYVVEYPTASAEQLQAYVRTLWGWEQAQRQREVKGMGVRFNVRIEDYPLLRDVVERLIAFVDVNQSMDNIPVSELKSLKLLNEHKKLEYRRKGYEKALAVLGNSPYFKGDFSNLYAVLDQYNGADDNEKIIKRFHEFVKLGNTKKISELVKHGFKGIKTYGHTDRYVFYGSPGHWDFVFTSSDINFQRAFTAWMCGAEALPKPSNEYLEYYILSYPQFMETEVWTSGPGFYLYAGKFPFEMTMMTSRYSAHPLSGYNRCPYAYTVMALLDDAVCDRLKISNWGYGTDHGRLYLNDKYSLESTAEGWLWRNDKKSVQWRKDWMKRFDISDEGWTDREGEFRFEGNVLLSTTQDRIRTAIKFITALYELVVEE